MSHWCPRSHGEWLRKLMKIERVIWLGCAVGLTLASTGCVVVPGRPVEVVRVPAPPRVVHFPPRVVIPPPPVVVVRPPVIRPPEVVVVARPPVEVVEPPPKVVVV